METIKAILVDDDNSALFDLNEVLESYSNIEIIGEYRNGELGLKAINKQRPDVVFVDIEMPILNGFEMLDKLAYEPIVIFCTGHVKYGAQAFRMPIRPADFITKPIEPKEFDIAVSRALADHERKRQSSRLQEQKIFAGQIKLIFNLNGEKKIQYFSPADIIYFESNHDYLQVYLRSAAISDHTKSPLIISKTMKEAVKEYSEMGFIQIHKSYLINLVHLESHSAKKIYLKGVEQPFSIGRTYSNNVKKKLEQVT